MFIEGARAVWEGEVSGTDAVWWKGGVKMCGKVLEMGQKGVICPHAPLTVKTGHSRSWYVYIYLYLQLNVTQQTSMCGEQSKCVRIFASM